MADPTKLAAALGYLSRLDEAMKGFGAGAKQFGAGVVDNLAGRAKDLGNLIYEAGTSDPNMGRMNTAEFSQAAAQRPQTPNLDQMWSDLGSMGQAIVTQPVETGKAIVTGEVQRVKDAFSDPRAAGNYAGSFIDPMKLAKMLKGIPSMRELDVHHGTPHRFPPTEANPLGEFDASKIGTGEGAQAYGHGVYLAESPDVAKGYKDKLTHSDAFVDGQLLDSTKPRHFLAQVLSEESGNIESARDSLEMFAKPGGSKSITESAKKALKLLDEGDRPTMQIVKPEGSLYKADLPDEMIDRMLDWDKPLSEQPDASKLVLKELLTKARKSFEGIDPNSNPIAGQIYHLYAQHRGGNSAAVAEELRQAGIPGIKYLDAGSRTAQGSGTRNFVVFPGEEKKVKILERK